MSFSSCSQLSPTLVKSKYTADEVLQKLEFTQPYSVTDQTPVTFGEKVVTNAINKEKFSNTPWEGAINGREFIIVEYTDPKQKTEWNYLYQVYLWKDHLLPFFVNRGDGMGLNLKYNGTSQPYYRVNYSRDLYVFKYPTLVEPNKILELSYVERKRIVRKNRMKVTSYTFRPEESKGVALMAMTKEPLRGDSLITYKIKVIEDDAWIVIEKKQEKYDINTRE